MRERYMDRDLPILLGQLYAYWIIDPSRFYKTHNGLTADMVPPEYRDIHHVIAANQNVVGHDAQSLLSMLPDEHRLFAFEIYTEYGGHINDPDAAIARTRAAKLVHSKNITANTIEMAYRKIVDGESPLEVREWLQERWNKLPDYTEAPVDPKKALVEDTARVLARIDSPTNEWGMRGYPTGFEFLDRIGGFPYNYYVLVAGRPSMGKSSLMFSLAMSQMEKGLKCLFITAEMSVEQMYIKAYSAMTGLTTQTVDRKVDLDSDDQQLIFKAAQDFMQQAGIYFMYLDDLNSIEATIYRWVRELEINCVYIDYIQNLRATGEKDVRLMINKISRRFKVMSLSHEADVVMVVGSQMKRTLQNEPPTLSDLKETGNLEQDADMVIALHREQGSSAMETTQIMVLKNKEGPLADGFAKLPDPHTRFVECDESGNLLDPENVPF